MTDGFSNIERQAQLSILLAEDHHVVRHGLRSLLQTQPDMYIAAEAANGLEVLELLKNGLNPEIILTDIHMPGMDGIELIEKLKQTESRAKLIVLSMLDNEKYIIKAFKAGADGYLLKNVTSQELLFAIGHVAGGGEYTCAEIAMRVMKRLVKSPQLPTAGELPDFSLSERDTEVLSLLSDGYTNQEIALKLFTSKRTVEGYRQNLMNRTGSRNTAALVKFAVLNGLLR